MQSENTPSGGDTKGGDGGGYTGGDETFNAEANKVLNEAKVSGANVEISYGNKDGVTGGVIRVTGKDGKVDTRTYTGGKWTKQGSDNLNLPKTSEHLPQKSKDSVAGSSRSGDISRAPIDVAKPALIGKPSPPAYGEGAKSAASAVLTAIGIDVVTPDPSDVVVPKWVAEAIMAIAAMMVLDHVAKMNKEIDRINNKPSQIPGYTYAIIITIPGIYMDVRGNLVNMKYGDIWKFGESTQSPDKRYQGGLDNYFPAGSILQPIYYGTQTEVKVMEKIHIYAYFFAYGKLPPGNRIFR